MRNATLRIGRDGVWVDLKNMYNMYLLESDKRLSSPINEYDTIKYIEGKESLYPIVYESSFDYTIRIGCLGTGVSVNQNINLLFDYLAVPSGDGRRSGQKISIYNGYFKTIMVGYVTDIDVVEFHYEKSTDETVCEFNLTIKVTDPTQCHYIATEDDAPESKYYGIEWDSSVATSVCARIGSAELHVSLPIQSQMRRCLLSNDGTVNYYLNANDSTKREDGTDANLDGSDGQVMVELPPHYRKFSQNGTKYSCMLSEAALPGFHYVPRAYRSAYESVVDRTNPSAIVLSSVMNYTTAFRGGNNNSSYDGTYRSLLGLPSSNLSVTNLRNYARNRGNGAKWNCDVYEVQKTCYWLYCVEYANFNCQLDFINELTPEGYKQGGLSNGVTTISSTDWGNYNNSNPIIPCGHTNSLGNYTGIVPFTLPEEFPSSLTVNVPSYRGLENPFGHIWHMVDGCKVRVQSNDSGGISEFYVCSNPERFQSTDYNDYELRGIVPRSNGYIRRLLVGEYGDNIATELGGGSTTYISDYFYTTIPNSGEAQRCTIYGGACNYGAISGLACTATYWGFADTATVGGTRLCYIP